MGNNKSKKRFGAILVIVCFALVGVARADWPEHAKLLASDGAAGDVFGRSVSISGDYAIVGASHNDANGAAYIFKRDGTSWLQQAGLTASDGTAGDCFGVSVSISGDYAIVGAYGDYDSGSYYGSAYIFKRSATSWTQQVKLTASDGADAGYFGGSVSINADYAIVGATRGDGNEVDSGSAYIFKRSDDPNDPNWTEQAKLTASDGAAWDNFGNSVAISGDYAIVGAYRDNTNVEDSGSAYIFTPNDLDPNDWDQQAKLTASDAMVGDHFGKSVSITADDIIVGASHTDEYGRNSGSVYIFERSDTSWIEQAKLLASDGDAWDYFGYSVSISGDYAIVGALGDDDNGADSGSAYVFKRSGMSWTEQVKLTALDAAAGDVFGRSVSISGDQTIVGADGDDSGTGSAYMFQRVCPDADLDGDCCVDLIDFAILGNQWLQVPADPSADIAPEGGDGVVDFLDLAVMTGQWLKDN